MKTYYVNLSALIVALLASSLAQADSCKGPWSENTIYRQDDQVTYNGITYTANKNADICRECQGTPPSRGQIWDISEKDKICPVIPTPEPECAATPVWFSNVLYPSGFQVTYKGFIYGAYGWPYGVVPDQTIGTYWLKGVACHTPPKPTPTPRPPKNTIPLPTQPPKPTM